MGLSDEQIRDMLELKEDLEEKIIKYKEQIEKLEKNISVLDSILKQSSFAKASDLTVDTKKQAVSIPITKNSDGTTIANVFVSDDKVSIVLEDNVTINPETPPLKTFFVDRIIGEMKKKDNQEAENGTIRRDYATSTGENAVHGSDSDKNAKKEIGFFFTESELIANH